MVTTPSVQVGATALRIPSSRQPVMVENAATGQPVFTRPWFNYLEKLSKFANEDPSTAFIHNQSLLSLALGTDALRAVLEGVIGDNRAMQTRLVMQDVQIAELRALVARLRADITSIQKQGPYTL